LSSLEGLNSAAHTAPRA